MKIGGWIRSKFTKPWLCYFDKRNRQGGLKAILSTLIMSGVSANILAASYELIDVSTSGGPANSNYAQSPSISADGRYVVFSHTATNLTGDKVSGTNIFLRDRLLNTTTLVSKGIGGAAADGTSKYPALSPNGRYIAYESTATNLVPGDTNNRSDIFRYDIQTGTTIRASVYWDGTQGSSDSVSASVSNDGKVAFVSDNLSSIGADDPGNSCYVHDPDNRTTTLVNYATNGKPITQCGNPAISADGTRVLFRSPENLTGVDVHLESQAYLRDLKIGQTTLVSTDTSGNPVNSGSYANQPFIPALSADGKVIAFANRAANLTQDPDNSGIQDVFVRNLSAGGFTIASKNSAGTLGNGDSPIQSAGRVQLSEDGTWVVFDTFATNLWGTGSASPFSVVVHNNVTGETIPVFSGAKNFSSGWTRVAISPDAQGCYVAFVSDAPLIPAISSSAGGLYLTNRCAAKPQSGWWWNPSESGRGFSIEVSGNTMFLAAYLYESSGRAAWYISAGPLNADGSYSGRLQEYTGGQSLTGGYKAPSVTSDLGPVSLSCTSTTSCSLTTAGGSVPIQRYVWDGSAAPLGAPETGWWWNASESGRGFFLEQQGNVLFLSGYMYDSAGNDVWYISSGPKTGNLFLGNWAQYGNGQTLTGVYKAPTVVNGDVGNLTIQFSDSTNGQMTMPDGRAVAITRYRF